MNKLLCIPALFLLFSSCLKPTNELADFYYQYYPNEINSWIEYEVTEIVHGTLSSDTLNYFLKEIKTNEFYDNEGQIATRIERFWKFNPNEDYSIKDVWQEKVTSTTAEKVEENNRYVKLIFPVKYGDYWDGNAFNSMPYCEYALDSIHQPFSINNYTFDSSLMVLQKDLYTAVDYQNAYEVYAKNIGLIYKKDVDLNINLYNITNINEGSELEMRIINYSL